MSARPKPLTPAQKRHLDEAYGPFPVPVTVIDEAREFVWVSPSFCTHYGKTADEVLGKTAACLVDAEGLARQQGDIAEFNAALGTQGYSIRRFTNLARGKPVRVLVVAFGRTIGRRKLRVGVAIPDVFTNLVPGIARLILRGDIDLDGFLEELNRAPRYRELLKELGTGASLKAAQAYGGERQNRKALERVVKIARKHGDPKAKAHLTTKSVMHLAVLLADRL